MSVALGERGRVLLGDVLRAALVTTARESLPAENPEVLRVFASVLWRAERALRKTRAEAIVDEGQRLFQCSPGTAEALAREAHDVSLQARLEELVLPRMDPKLLPLYVRVEGELPERGLVVVPHAGNALWLVAILAWARPGLVCVQRSPLGTARGWIQRRIAGRFADELTRLPVLWEADPGALRGHLEAGRLVIVAADDRGWPGARPVTLLGRPALLSEEPWEVARALGVTVTPAFVYREQDKTWRASFGAPIEADLERWVRERAEPWLRLHGAQYLGYCADCRLGLEPAPLFADAL